MIHAEEAETSLALALGQRVEMDRATRDAWDRGAAVKEAGCSGRRSAATGCARRARASSCRWTCSATSPTSGVVGDAPEPRASPARDRRRAHPAHRPGLQGDGRKGVRWPTRVDLSQPLSRESQLHPFFAPTQILRHIRPRGRGPGTAVVQRRGDHHVEPRGTHVDAFGHYDPKGSRSPRCRSTRSAATRSVSTSGTARRPRRDRRGGRAGGRACGQELREADILLFCSDHYNRTAGTPAFLDGFCGISAEAVHWMADRALKFFGVETISPRPCLPHRRVPDAPRMRGTADALRRPEQPGGGRRASVPVRRLPARLGAGLWLALRAAAIVKED